MYTIGIDSLLEKHLSKMPETKGHIEIVFNIVEIESNNRTLKV